VGAITAVDVRFNAGQCFYMDAANARAGCMHFPSVVLHEFAHVIGLDHPDEHPERNLDLDADPGNRLEVGCGAPLAELRASRRTERFAVANARWSGDDPWRRGLTYDDFAGRDALYPDCGIAAAPAVAGGPRLWGAFARGEGSAYGWARGYDDAGDARRRAVAECGRHGRGCRVVTEFDACFAYARSSEVGAWGWAARSDPDSAAAASVAHCRAYGPGCEAALAVCAVDGG
jgi:hypothetical protein